MAGAVPSHFSAHNHLFHRLRADCFIPWQQRKQGSGSKLLWLCCSLIGQRGKSAIEMVSQVPDTPAVGQLSAVGVRSTDINKVGGRQKSTQLRDDRERAVLGSGSGTTMLT